MPRIRLRAHAGCQFTLSAYWSADFTNVIQADKELLDGAEDERSLGTPTVRVVVPPLFDTEQPIFPFQDRRNTRVGGEDIFPDQCFDSALFCKRSCFIDRRKNRQVVHYTQTIVFLSVSGCNVDHARPCIHCHEIRWKDRSHSIQQRVPNHPPVQFGTLELLQRVPHATNNPIPGGGTEGANTVGRQDESMFGWILLFPEALDSVFGFGINRHRLISRQ